jgi:hypothetical protein
MKAAWRVALLALATAAAFAGGMLAERGQAPRAVAADARPFFAGF